MESRVKLLGHPVHQMLIPVPAGLFITAAILDVVDAIVATSWIPTVSFWNIVLGIVSGLVAAVFGAADWLKIPQNTRARRVGALHGISNVVAVLLFGLSVWLRADLAGRRIDALTLAMEITALAVLVVAAWLGGELVDRLGIGVDDGAHVDAPSSLREKHVPTRH